MISAALIPRLCASATNSKGGRRAKGLASSGLGIIARIIGVRQQFIQPLLIYSPAFGEFTVTIEIQLGRP